MSLLGCIFTAVTFATGLSCVSGGEGPDEDDVDNGSIESPDESRPDAGSAEPPVVTGPVAEQVANGESIYTDLCASCHGANGEGTGVYPPVVGPEALPRFPPPSSTMRTIQFVTAEDVYVFVHDLMPLNAAGSLSSQQSLELVSFVLNENGLALAEPLTLLNAADVVIRP